jgi:hypothetical protein
MLALSTSRGIHTSEATMQALLPFVFSGGTPVILNQADSSFDLAPTFGFHGSTLKVIPGTVPFIIPNAISHFFEVGNLSETCSQPPILQTISRLN